MTNIKRGFKRKTIIKTIEEKIDDWLKTIKDEELVQQIRENYILTGGAITSMLLGDSPNDYDIYFRDKEVAKKVINYYLEKVIEKNNNSCVDSIEVVDTDIGVQIIIKSAGIAETGEELGGYEYFESLPPEEMDKFFTNWNRQAKKESYQPALFSSNAVTLHDGIQIITRFVGPPEEIHKYYDFVHCTNWYTAKEGLNLNLPALESILARELRYVGSKYPICSMFRLKKFIKRGWTITAGEMLKIAWDINALDLKDTYVLRDQLTGVDAAYFHQVLRMLENEKDIERTYLFEVINRVFDEEED